MIRKALTKLITRAMLPPNPYPGEMLPIERVRLYQWMMEFRPKCVLEVGTGVGGSTFYISQALSTYGGRCIPATRCEVRRSIF